MYHEGPMRLGGGGSKVPVLMDLVFLCLLAMSVALD